MITLAMNTELWKLTAKWELEATIILWFINFVVFLVFTFGVSGFQLNSSSLFSKLTFVETGITLLAGGIIAFSGSVSASKSKEFISKTEQHWTVHKLRSREKQANKYLLLAALLFLQSIIISFFGF